MTYLDFQQLRDAMSFLDNHPAVNAPESGTFFTSNFVTFPDAFCKHGVPLKGMEPADATVSIKSGHPRFIELSARYPDTVDTIEDVHGDTVASYMEVPYADFYGEAWTFDHTLYVGRLLLYQACGEQVGAYDYATITAETYDQLVVNVAGRVKEDLGTFSDDDFMTDAERRNHDTCEPFVFGGTNEAFEMRENPDYMDVGWNTINKRWWEWFAETDLYHRVYEPLTKRA